MCFHLFNSLNTFINSLTSLNYVFFFFFWDTRILCIWEVKGMFHQKVMLSISNAHPLQAWKVPLKSLQLATLQRMAAVVGLNSWLSHWIQTVTQFQGEKCSWKLSVYPSCSIIHISSVHLYCMFCICVLYSCIRPVKRLIENRIFSIKGKNIVVH